ncbi:Z-DNA-binding protein 1/Z-DNA complex-binding [Caudoviricetes sp.]|nr:Z-DNA-binding protein 1/Z-DNA complex-binding [Caudoviricetes sp.]
MINKVSGNGVSRAVFDYIYEHQGVRVDKVIDALVDCGFKRTSIGSLISQMVAQYMVERSKDGYLWPLVAEYQPLKSTKKKKPARKTVDRAEPVLVAAEPAPTKVQVTAASLLETLSVLEAHALYHELHLMFGEK